MKKETKKKSAYIGGGAAGIVAAVVAVIMTLSGPAVPVECEYELQPTSSISSRVTLTMPHEQVPNATFYALMFNDEPIGLSTFGEESNSGITTANILFAPIENLLVAVYNGDMRLIGIGQFEPDGRITVNIEKDEVAER